MDNKIVDINSKRFKKQSIEIQTQLLDDGSVWFRVKDGGRYRDGETFYGKIGEAHV